MPCFYTNSCNPVYDRWNFTSENIFDYSNERTDSFDIPYDGSWLKLDQEKQEDKIVIENDVVVSKKSIAYGCKIINDRPIEVGDFVVVDDTFDSYNTVCVVMEVARSYLCLYRFKNNDFKHVRPSPFRAYIPNDKVKEETVNLANCTIQNCDCEILQLALNCIKYPEIVNAISMPTCDCCGEKIASPIRIGDKKYCRRCYENMFVRCSRCGSNELRENATETRDGGYLCKDCGKYHFITAYHHYYPKVKFFGNNHSNTVPYLGFELEVDEGGESDRNCTKLMKDINKPDEIFAYCSHDGSLSDGFEIITQPASMEYHNSIKDVYAKSFSNLKKIGYMSHDTTTCGFHVHFNRSYYGENEKACIRKLLFMTEKFWNELVLFARRPEHRMERYAKKIEPMEITDYMRRADKSGSHEFHYYAVNLANYDTIEFRMFRGSLNVNTVIATLQLVNNMVVASKEKTLEEIKAMKFEDLLTTRVQKAYWKRHSALPDTEE